MPATTADLSATLRGVCADPADTLARLAYADACEEAGDTLRAEYIRLALRLATLEADPSRPTDPMVRAGWLAGMHVEYAVMAAVCGWGECQCEQCVRKRAGGLLGLHGDTWALPLALAMGFSSDQLGSKYYGWRHRNVVPMQGEQDVRWTWRLGFIDSVTCTLADWLTYGALAVLAHPITAVTITDRKLWRGRWSQSDTQENLFGWWTRDGVNASDLICDLPTNVMDVLSLDDRRLRKNPQAYKYCMGCVLFNTDADAVAAMSDALVEVARRTAGLPTLLIPDGTERTR